MTKHAGGDRRNVPAGVSELRQGRRQAESAKKEIFPGNEAVI